MTGFRSHTHSVLYYVTIVLERKINFSFLDINYCYSEVLSKYRYVLVYYKNKRTSIKACAV